MPRTRAALRFDLEHFQVVIELHAGAGAGGDARMNRDRGAPVEYHYLVGPRETRTLWPMNRTGTEYLIIRMVISDDRSTRG